MQVIGKSETLSPPKRKKLSHQRRDMFWGFTFLSPWIIGFLGLTLLPMLATLVISFTNFQLSLENISFVGWNNYLRMFDDPLFYHSLKVTGLFMLIALPFSILMPLGFAMLLNAKNLPAKRFFSTMFYMPYMVPLVSAVLVWAGFMNAQTGWMNIVLESVGIAGPNWLNSTFWIYPALLIIGVWSNGNAMITILASMQGVPTELYEASRVDGAGPIRRFWSVTLPLISPMIFYNLILAIVGLGQYFLEPYVLKRGTGDPGNATMFYNMYLYKNFFQYQDMAYGATLAWVLFAIILALTGLLFWSQRFWVYQAERK